MSTGGDCCGLRSGDVILYSGQHQLHRVHQKRTGCPWGQVGLILRLPGEAVPLVFESTTVSQARDVITGTLVRGVQLTRLPERVGSFEGAVAVRELNPPLPDELEQRLRSFAERMHGRPFNDNKWIALRSFHRRNEPSLEPGYFCSELVAEAYQWTGLLPRPPRGMTSNNYIPADFSSCYSNRILPLAPAFKLGDEQLCSIGPNHSLHPSRPS